MRFTWFRRVAAFAAVASLAAGLAVSERRAALYELLPERYLEHVKTLSSEGMRGRGTGMPELDQAARYVARHFKQAGLEPLTGRSFLQPFAVTTNARLGKRNRFSYAVQGQRSEAPFETTFMPFNFSARGEMSGQIVFAGYGITAAEYNYDDYAGLDARGKIVLVLRHEPQEFDEKSVFAGKVYTEHAQFFSKVTNAKAHGAVGVILINDRAAHAGEPDELEKFGRTVGPANAGIPFVHLKAEIAERWIAEAGRNLTSIQKEIDADLKPRSFALPASIRVEAWVDVDREVKTVHNVVGYLRGQTDEYVVIGAHYDHLGLGEQFSMAPSLAGTPHPGADDNASGTSGVIELAYYFASRPRPKRGLLFVAFAGEELGLLGSSFFVNHPPLPLGRAAAMLNMDMIGRVKDGKVYVGGVGTGSNLRKLMEEAGADLDGLRIDFSDATGYGSSDHTSFTSKQVPVLFFFSGLHSDYHKPSDTWEKINAAGAAKVLRLVARSASALADGGERPQFVRVRDPRPSHGAVAGSSSAGGQGTGYGPYFGSIPDFAEVPNGVKFADVREDSPAAQAGLKGGDILFEFDGKPVGNLYDFTYLLRSKKAGDQVLVKVRRGTETVETRVVLGQRK